MRDKIILLVEDNPDDQELTLLALEESEISLQIVIAQDGEEALNYLFGKRELAPHDKSLTPDLILLDLKLPKIDGLELLGELRTHQQTKFLPVVVLTTSTEEQDLIQSYSLGCNSYIRKPVDFQQFQTAVKQLGLYWLLLNQSPPMLEV